MTAIHYELKVNWGKVLFNVLKDMVDKSQRKAKGFAAQIGVLLKGIPAIALGEGVPFPFAKILSMKTVNTYIATNTTIDAREEQGMVSEGTVKRKSKSTKQSSSADNTPVKVISEVAGSKKRVATEDIAPAIPKKRRTVKTKSSSSQASLDIMPVAQDVVPIQVIDPTHVVATIKSPAPKRKSRMRRLTLPTGSDDETMDTQELAKDTDEAAVKPTDEVDIIIEQVLEETLNLGVNEEEHGGQGVDDTMFTEDFAQWLDDFVSRNSEPEIVGTRTITEIAGSTSPMVVKDMNRAVLEETLNLGVNEEEHGGQGVDDTMFTEDFAQWLDDFVSRTSEPEIVGTRTITEIAGSTSPMVVKDMNRAISSMFTNEELMSIDDLLLQISDDMLLKISDDMKIPEPAIDNIFVPPVLFIEPVQYWEAVPWLIRNWQWIKVCTEIVQFSMLGGLRPVREDICQDITVYNLGIERIPADFLSMFVQGMACHNFVDSVVQMDSGDIQEVDITGDEEVDLVSSDVSTVYRSPSPIFQEVDSVEHDLQFSLGPAIFPSVAKEERLYFVQSPASSPATYQPQESSSSSTDVSMHFDSADIPLNAQADSQESAPVDFTMFTDALEDLRSSISQRIHDSNCEILSKVNAVEIGVREALLKQHALLRQSLQDACRVQERQGITQAMQMNDLKKGFLAPVVTLFQDLMAIKKGQREQDAKITALDTQIAAIRSEQLDFQSKIAADLLSLSTQLGDIVDHIRGGDAKKGEIGSSSRRPPPIRVERRPLPTPANQGESSSGHGRVPSVEEAAEMIREADRQADRREREREKEKRLRRLRRRGH
ncbi:hypothetical protein F511_17973 [Dorcoceras hygrometricum]|uniref:Uncharacterized protein n=1 Tax=Dorcoceras hygrometricum TaxID=472368 RepID=A0A2Z7AQ98_9LAMI|nr:hypothetical protein F511_17973 [Dorcoceras hygrometricum]